MIRQVVKADFEYLIQLKILICNLMLSIRKDDDHGYCKSFGHGNLRNETRPEFAALVTMTTGFLILSLAAGKVSYLFETMNRLKESFPIDSSYLTVLIKIIGITYIGQFSSAICKDAGYQTIGTQIDLFCKLSVMVLSMPVLLAILDTISEFMI